MKQEIIQRILEEILGKLGIDSLTIEVRENDDGSFYINLSTPEAGLLIGRHGENIASLQFLLKSILYNELEEQVSFLIDIEGYREEQEKNILKLARQGIEEVLATGMPVTLPPMNAYFRKKIHMMVAEGEFQNITTESQGDGTDRAVILKIK